MNERIREFVKQAQLDDPMCPIDEWDNPELEKFAQLIVQECLDVVESRRSRGTVEVCKQECKAVMAEIKHHFGIE